MNLHEYQSKALFSQYGLSVPTGQTISSIAEIDDAIKKLDHDSTSINFIVKAQVHTGGRGKAGGVKRVTSLAELKQTVANLLGTRLVTHQTDETGLPINKILIETLSNIKRELYLSLLVDRSSERLIIMASEAGGMDIEEVARTQPEKILTETLHPVAGYQAYIGRKLAFKLGLEGVQIRQFSVFLAALVKLFNEKDASLIEINPLVVSEEGNLIALDAKINLDGNALYRHPDLVAIRDISQEDERVTKASEYQLNYIPLEGNIGCMVNGAGLAMATMDLIKYHGGEPANFLDVGGGTTAERVAAAFKIILSDRNVKSVLVNIFGGIVRCDLIAEGIIAATKEVKINVPIIVRLEGTNVEQGRALLKNQPNIISATGLKDAAEKAVAATKGELE